MFFTLRSRHEISVPCMFKIMPILHTLCQQLLMLKIPLHRQTTSHYREEETINYWASLDCLHDTLECWNIQTKYFSGYFSQLPQVSPSRVENGVILNNLSSHSLQPQPPHSPALQSTSPYQVQNWLPFQSSFQTLSLHFSLLLRLYL